MDDPVPSRPSAPRSTSAIDIANSDPESTRAAFRPTCRCPVWEVRRASRPISTQPITARPKANACAPRPLRSLPPQTAWVGGPAAAAGCSSIPRRWKRRSSAGGNSDNASSIRHRRRPLRRVRRASTPARAARGNSPSGLVAPRRGAATASSHRSCAAPPVVPIAGAQPDSVIVVPPKITHQGPTAPLAARWPDAVDTDDRTAHARGSGSVLRRWLEAQRDAEAVEQVGRLRPRHRGMRTTQVDHPVDPRVHLHGDKKGSRSSQRGQLRATASISSWNAARPPGESPSPRSTLSENNTRYWPGCSRA